MESVEEVRPDTGENSRHHDKNISGINSRVLIKQSDHIMSKHSFTSLGISRKSPMNA